MVATGLDNVHAYKGKIGILFVASGPIPLLETGFYQVFIDLEGKRVRTLAFDVEISPANQ